ncbi:MAG: cytochrome c peroxidase [Methyloglobulus sp.]
MQKLPIAGLLLVMLCPSFASQAGQTLNLEQRLGASLYKDENLSLNRNQSCASCHSVQPYDYPQGIPGFVDPDNVNTGTPVSLGSVSGAAGSLNAPSAGYAAYSPLFQWDSGIGGYKGGQFWNGRAKDLVEQAKGPFLNPAEMAMPSKWAVVRRLREDSRYPLWLWYVYGVNLLDVPYDYQQDSSYTPPVVDVVYDLVARAISAFEQSNVFNKFNSKFDYVLAGKSQFTPLEEQGFALFNDPNKGNCATCHVSTTTTDGAGNTIPPLFTDFTYDNLGLPQNFNIPGNPAPDLGLGGRADIAAVDPEGKQIGKHKVMSLRNIAITPPYGHNGVFASLEQIVHFYNTRDTLGWVWNNQDDGFAVTGWPDPEIPQTVNHQELGNLGLTADEEDAIVAFLKTLTDDYQVPLDNDHH